MSKQMKKAIVSAVAIMLLVATLAVVLVACNADSYKKRLEKAGYSIESANIEDFGEIGEEFEIEFGLYGEKTNVTTLDWVILLKFKNADDAKSFEKIYKIYLNEEAGVLGEEADVRVERQRTLLLLGTEQGIKDAK